MSETRPESTYGPSALVTPANFITVFRLLLAPLLFVRITEEGASWVNVALWVALAGTDGIDGWFARRHGTTRSGAFLDPLADKVLVLGALFSLVSIDRFWWLPVALIAVRELGISLYRVHFARRGLAVPARSSAKAKTLVQLFAVGSALTPALSSQLWIADGLLWAAVALALFSAGQYLRDGASAMTTFGHHGSAG